MRVAMPQELSAWIAARIASYPSEVSELPWEAPHLARFEALPLYHGWWETIGVRSDGVIVSWSTEGEYTGVRPVEDRYLWLSALVFGTRRYPELRPLLPPRPAGAVDCRHLGLPVFDEGKVFCPDCCGLGWVDPADT
jgi:hypothetical protein